MFDCQSPQLPRLGVPDDFGFQGFDESRQLDVGLELSVAEREVGWPDVFTRPGIARAIGKVPYLHRVAGSLVDQGAGPQDDAPQTLAPQIEHTLTGRERHCDGRLGKKLLEIEEVDITPVEVILGCKGEVAFGQTVDAALGHEHDLEHHDSGRAARFEIVLHQSAHRPQRIVAERQAIDADRVPKLRGQEPLHDHGIESHTRPTASDNEHVGRRFAGARKQQVAAGHGIGRAAPVPIEPEEAEDQHCASGERDAASEMKSRHEPAPTHWSKAFRSSFPCAVKGSASTRMVRRGTM